MKKIQILIITIIMFLITTPSFGATMAIHQISRKNRTQVQVANRVEDVALFVSGESSLTQSVDWITAALSEPGGAVSRPFYNHPEILTYYEPYTDRLMVIMDEPQGDALPNLTSGEFLDDGVGLAVAQAQAQVFRNALETSGIISPGNFATSPYDTAELVNAGSEYNTNVYTWVKGWIFVYYHEEYGLPLFDSKIVIHIDRDGSLYGLEVSELDLNSTSSVSVEWSEEEALELVQDHLLGLADAYAARYGSNSQYETASFWQRPRVGYQLKPEQTSNWTYPTVWVKTTFRHNGPNSLDLDLDSMAIPAAVSLVDPEDNWEDVLDWMSAPSVFRNTAPENDNGQSCIDDGDCDSGYCYNPYGFAGKCGECSTDDTGCYSSQNCSFNDIMDRDEYPTCESRNYNSGFGLTCNSDNDCGYYYDSGWKWYTCETVSPEMSLMEFSGCSKCEDHGDCSGYDTCNLQFDANNWRFGKDCVGFGTQINGQVCDADDPYGHYACQSFVCAPLNVANYGEIGVCSDCVDNSDCQSGEACKIGSISYYPSTSEWHIEPNECVILQ